MNNLTIAGNIATDIYYAEREINGVLTPVANFNVAANRGVGENKKTDFFHVTLWRKAAEIMHQYGAKGRSVIINGAVTLESYTTTNKETNQPETRYTLGIPRVESFEFAAGQRSGEKVQNEAPEECPFPVPEA